MTKTFWLIGGTSNNLHLELGAPIVVLVVDIIESLDDLLEAGDELMFAVQLEQRPANLPVDDRCVIHEVMTSVCRQTPQYYQHYYYQC